LTGNLEKGLLSWMFLDGFKVGNLGNEALQEAVREETLDQFSLATEESEVVGNLADVVLGLLD